MSEDFDPTDHEREPREEGWEEETDELFDLIQDRGDQRIGQYLINAVRHKVKKDYSEERLEEDFQDLVYNKLWTAESDELLQILEEFDDEVRNR